MAVLPDGGGSQNWREQIVCTCNIASIRPGAPVKLKFDECHSSTSVSREVDKASAGARRDVVDNCSLGNATESRVISVQFERVRIGTTAAEDDADRGTALLDEINLDVSSVALDIQQGSSETARKPQGARSDGISTLGGSIGYTIKQVDAGVGRTRMRGLGP